MFLFLQERSPLSLAAEAGHFHVVAYLIDKGAHIGYLDDDVSDQILMYCHIYVQC